MLSLLLAAAALAAGEYPVPPPEPVHGDVMLGCYYFPGHFDPLRWRPMVEYGEPVPVLGYYRDGEPEVSDWHIRFALEHGIRFFVFDWYYDHATRAVSFHNTALDDGFLRSRYGPLMRFGLMWCNESPGPPDYTRAHMVGLAEVLVERYLARENYLRIDGRPMLWISRPLHLIDGFGADGLRDVIGEMNGVLAQAGIGPLFLVANATERLDEVARAGFDAVSAYNYPTAGMGPGERRAPYATMVTGIRAIWRDVSERSGLPYIPPISPGWDSRPWYGEDTLVRTDPSPELFERMCRDSLEFVDPKLNMVIAECWNEFGEGSYVEPTLRYGFGSLDAMRRVFCPTAGPHRDLTPQALQVPVPVFDEIPSLTEADVAAQGGNRVYNPGAERRWGWAYYDGSPAERVTETPYAGRYCVRVPADKSGAKSLWLIAGEAGATYRVSARVRCGPGAEAVVKVAPFRTAFTWAGRYVDIGRASGADWVEVAGQYVVPADAPYISIELSVTGGDAWFDEASVVKSD